MNVADKGLQRRDSKGKEVDQGLTPVSEAPLLAIDWVIDDVVLIRDKATDNNHEAIRTGRSREMA